LGVYPAAAAQLTATPPAAPRDPAGSGARRSVTPTSSAASIVGQAAHSSPPNGSFPSPRVCPATCAKLTPTPSGATKDDLAANPATTSTSSPASAVRRSSPPSRSSSSGVRARHTARATVSFDSSTSQELVILLGVPILRVLRLPMVLVMAPVLHLLQPPLLPRFPTPHLQEFLLALLQCSQPSSPSVFRGDRDGLRLIVRLFGDARTDYAWEGEDRTDYRGL